MSSGQLGEARHAPSLRVIQVPGGAIEHIDRRGWLRIILCTIGASVSVIPIAIVPVSIFIKPLHAAMGWGRGEIALTLTCLSLSIAISMPLAGLLIDRFGVWKVATLSLALFGSGMLLLPLSIGHFGLAGLYGLSCLNGIIGAASSSLVYCKLISGWFDKGRGFALGCALSGIALGGVIAPLVGASAIQAFGWKAGFYSLGLLPLLVGIPAVLVLRSTTVGAVEAPEIEIFRYGDGFAEASRTRVFLTLLMVFLIVCFTLNAVQIHLAAFLSDRGASATLSAAALSGVYLISIPTRIITGMLFDRMFAPWVASLCITGAALGVALLLVPSSSPLVVSSAVILFGIGIGAENDLMALLVSRYFGMRAFAQIYGALYAAFMLGGAAGPYLLGVYFDVHHDYVRGLWLCIVGLAISAALLLLMPRYPASRDISGITSDPARPAKL